MSQKNFVSLILGTIGGTVNTKVGEIAGEVGMTPPAGMAASST